MQGVHAFEAKTKVSIDLESFVAADHFLRKIDRVLGTAFVRELTASRYAAQQGRPSIDPEVYFRMQLVAYFLGITSVAVLGQRWLTEVATAWVFTAAAGDLAFAVRFACFLWRSNPTHS